MRIERRRPRGAVLLSGQHLSQLLGFLAPAVLAAECVRDRAPARPACERLLLLCGRCPAVSLESAEHLDRGQVRSQTSLAPAGDADLCRGAEVLTLGGRDRPHQGRPRPRGSQLRLCCSNVSS